MGLRSVPVTRGWPERRRLHGQAPPDRRPMVARVRRVPRRALHFDRAWRRRLQPRLAVLRRCRVVAGIATCPASISRHVRAGHGRGVGGRRSSRGRARRPGVGAASTSERGWFSSAPVAPGELTARRVSVDAVHGPADGGTSTWSSAAPSPSPRASELSATIRARRRWSSGNGDW